jgi:tagatose 6-phosphate kinase
MRDLQRKVFQLSMRTEPSQIITVTANTALDEVLVARQSQKVKLTFDTIRRFLFPSGKGVNVARAVASLGSSVCAIGLVGTDTAATFEKALVSPRLRAVLLAAKGNTRINTTLCDAANRAVIHIRREALQVSDKEFGGFAQEVQSAVMPGSIVVFGGTLPKGVSPHKLTKLIELCNRSNAITIIDSSGSGLQAALLAKPFMIKPNVEELAELIQRPLDPRDTASLLDAIEIVSSTGVRLVALSRGSRGMLVRLDNQVWTASVRLDRQPAETGAIGSGDAAVAGFAVGLAEHRVMPDVIRLAVACGAANALSFGPAVLRKVDVKRLYSKVSIRELR